MDALFEVLAARGYIEGISAITGELNDTEVQLTGWQVHQLLAPITGYLERIEKELKKG